jgi:hypothetical protein
MSETYQGTTGVTTSAIMFTAARPCSAVWQWYQSDRKTHILEAVFASMIRHQVMAQLNGRQPRGGDRKLVKLRGLEDVDILSWQSADRLDPERTDWAEVVSVVGHANGTCTVTVAVDATRFAELTDGCCGKRAIAEVIASAFLEDAWRILKNDALKEDVATIPVVSEASVFGPLTVVVEWDFGQASSVAKWIATSCHEVGCIELERIGRIGDVGVSLVVALPVAIFDAAMVQMRHGPEPKSLATCVFEAINEAFIREPTTPREWDDDTIPF